MQSWENTSEDIKARFHQDLRLANQAALTHQKLSNCHHTKRQSKQNCPLKKVTQNLQDRQIPLSTFISVSWVRPDPSTKLYLLLR